MAVKEQCKEKFGKDVRVNSSGCLGYCERGIAAVIYPAGEWIFDLTKKDDEALVEKVKQHHSKNR